MHLQAGHSLLNLRVTQYIIITDFWHVIQIKQFLCAILP